MEGSRVTVPRPPRARGIRAISPQRQLGVVDFEEFALFESHDGLNRPESNATFADFEIPYHDDLVLQTARKGRLIENRTPPREWVRCRPAHHGSAEVHPQGRQ